MNVPTHTLLPREKIAVYGAENLSSAELIALILGTGSRKQSVFELATQVDLSFPDRQTHWAQLLTQHQHQKLLAALEWGQRQTKPRTRPVVTSADDVATCAQDIRAQTKEYVMGLYLNGRQELIAKEILTVGSLNRNSLTALDVFSPALKLPSAHVILVHNHPSGHTGPSQADIETTRRLVQAGELLGVTLLDHVIVTTDSFNSLRELGFF